MLVGSVKLFGSGSSFQNLSFNSLVVMVQVVMMAACLEQEASREELAQDLQVTELNNISRVVQQNITSSSTEKRLSALNWLTSNYLLPPPIIAIFTSLPALSPSPEPHLTLRFWGGRTMCVRVLHASCPIPPSLPFFVSLFAKPLFLVLLRFHFGYCCPQMCKSAK